MTDEQNEADFIETQIRVESVSGGSIKDAEELRLTIQGQSLIIMAVAEIALMFLREGLGGEIDRARDGEGNPIDLGPTRLDVMSTGDDPVA